MCAYRVQCNQGYQGHGHGCAGDACPCLHVAVIRPGSAPSPHPCSLSARIRSVRWPAVGRMHHDAVGRSGGVGEATSGGMEEKGVGETGEREDGCERVAGVRKVGGQGWRVGSCAKGAEREGVAREGCGEWSRGGWLVGAVARGEERAGEGEGVGMRGEDRTGGRRAPAREGGRRHNLVGARCKNAEASNV